MKMVNLFLAVVLSLGLGFVATPDISYAKSEKEVTKNAKSAAKSATTKSIPKNININTADKKELIQLPGVGPVTADAIVKYRKKNGKFKSINDLTKVKGIGDKTIKKIEPFLKKI